MNKLTTGIDRAEKLASELHELVQRLVQDAKDYDAERVLKRTEAELMDLRHNLSLVKRLMKQH